MSTKPVVRGGKLYLPAVFPFLEARSAPDVGYEQMDFGEGSRTWITLPHTPDHALIATRMIGADVCAQRGVMLPGPAFAHWAYPGFRSPFLHQRHTVDFLTKHRKCFVLSEMGCVDADTEYLSPTGWKRIADYDGGKVMQYDRDTGTGSWVQPTEFIKRPCQEFIHWRHSRGLDQMLSGEHRMLVDRPAGSEVHSAANLASASFNQLQRTTIRNTFDSAGGGGLPHTAAELRLAVAIAADGHIPSDSAKRVYMRLKKPRKVERMKALLGAAEREHTIRFEPSTGFTVFAFYDPWCEKSMAGWYEASPVQLDIIVDEARHWDGSSRKAGAYAFCTTDKATADFMSYAAAGTGRTCYVTSASRARRVTADYVVHIRSGSAPVGLVGVVKGERRVHAYPAQHVGDGFKYCFAVPKTFLVLRRGGNVFITGNTGKTGSVLWASEYLLAAGAAKRVLILSPLSTLKAVWVRELFQVNPAKTMSVAWGSKEKREKALYEDDVQYVVTNHDALRLMDMDKIIRRFDLVVLDEAGVFRTWSSGAMPKRYKAISKLANGVQRFWALTGTPTPNGPADAWALARLVNPNVTRSVTEFRMQVLRQISEFRWVPKPGSEKIVSEVLQPSIRFTKSDVLANLPPIMFSDREVALSAEQNKARDKLRKDLVLQLNGETITAVNAAVLLGKSLQIACGTLLDADGTAHELDYGSRLNEVLDLIEQTSAKTIVFGSFKASLNRLYQDVKKKYSVELVTGDTPAGRRADIYNAFQTATDPQVLIAHPGTTAHGITLTAADLIVWFGPTTSAEWYEQANARAHRPGQKRTVSVVHIAATAEERRIYKTLKERGDMQSEILRLAKEFT